MARQIIIINARAHAHLRTPAHAHDGRYILIPNAVEKTKAIVAN